jgi:hypothetical protein
MASKPPNDRAPRDRRRPESTEPAGEEPTFGSFISDSVRRSSARFRGEEEPERPSRRRDATSREPRASTPREPAESDRFGVPRRPRYQEVPPEEPIPAAPVGPERPVWMQEAIERAGSPERAMAYAGGAVIALILLIWLLASVVGGGGGGAPTATEELQVLPIGQQSGTPPSGPGRAIVTPTPGPEPSPTPRGSDNILTGLPVSSPAAASHPPTAFCQDSCLARVERTPEAPQVLAASRTRPSYSSDNWYWVVAGPKGIEPISSRLDTEVVRESTETLDLYMVVLPTPETDDEPAGLLGNVIDEVGVYRLVAAASVPAKVKPVTDWGLAVEKVAPAPPDTVAQHGDRPELTEPDIGGMMNDVSADNMTRVISDLQASGSTDGSGVGTRFYPTRANQMAAEYLYRELESYGLNVWYEDFISWDGYLLLNVVGEIEGRDPSRLYGVMAHFDTISDKPTTTAPGADDNATGVASGLEIARILAGWDIKYSFRVIFVNYEEQGVVGSQEWAKDAVASGEPWEGVFNIDSVGSSRNGYQVVLNSAGESVWMEDLIKRVNDAYGVGETLKVLQDKDIVADDNRLRDQGIESVMIARELYGWSPLHHTTKDVKENVSIPHAQNCAVLILLTVASLLV